MDKDGDVKSEERGRTITGWLIVSGLALLFLIYGMFMFYMLGDKGPPGWDFGTVEDIPGQSVYSTHPGAPGTTPDPEPQHVLEKPPFAKINPGRRKK